VGAKRKESDGKYGSPCHHQKQIIVPEHNEPSLLTSLILDAADRARTTDKPASQISFSSENILRFLRLLSFGAYRKAASARKDRAHEGQMNSI
jgi:hypothetical protein